MDENKKGGATMHRARNAGTPAAICASNSPRAAALRLDPQCQRILLGGRLRDLNTLCEAYTAVECLLRPANECEKEAAVTEVPQRYLCSLLEVLNERMSELMFEAQQGFDGSEP